MITESPEIVPYPRQVFCSRNLRMDTIRYIGFDMDYTLARYTRAMEHLQAEMVLAKLASKPAYGSAVSRLAYDPHFAIRGLTVDTHQGHVFKMDAHRFVGRVFHGLSKLDPASRRAAYTNTKVSPADPRYVMVDTQFSLPEISLYCQLVEHMDNLHDTLGAPDYASLWDDVREAMDGIHRDGTLKAVVRSDLPRYIERDPELAETLHRFRSAGKRLFLVTNSEPDYTEAVMTHLLDGAYTGYDRWRDYFEVAITSARKPLFFSGDEPFLEVNEDLEVTTVATTALQRGALYAGGNVGALTEAMGMVGEEVMYVGDHIYGDIVRSKTHTHWRTVMVVQEMESELETLERHRASLDQLQRDQRERFQLTLEHSAKRRDGDRAPALAQEIRDRGRALAAFEESIDAAFNANWGSAFRDRAELSAFGAQVESYACLYTGRVSNFRFYSPQWYFRSPRARMPHELRL